MCPRNQVRQEERRCIKRKKRKKNASETNYSKFEKKKEKKIHPLMDFYNSSLRWADRNGRIPSPAVFWQRETEHGSLEGRCDGL